MRYPSRNEELPPQEGELQREAGKRIRNRLLKNPDLLPRKGELPEGTGRREEVLPKG